MLALRRAGAALRRPRTWVGIALLATLVLALWGLFSLRVGGRANGDLLQHMTRDQLELEKLRQEIENLRQQRSLIATVAPYLAAAVAISGAFLAWGAQIAERGRQRRSDADQRDKDRLQRQAAQQEEARQRKRDRQLEAAELAQREAETERRLDENFASVAANLGSPSAAIQASAAVSLLSFLRPGLEAYQRRVFLLVLANLKVDHTREVNKLLVRVFERAVRLQLRQMSPDERTLLMDLSDARLDTVDLSGLDLSESDLGFATLQYAKLRGASLFRVRGYHVHLEKASLSGRDTTLEEARLRKAHCLETHFHDANLTSARLEEADLTGAQFYRARLQSAHLDETTLRGTRFDEADLNDAFLRRLKEVDEASLRSLSRAKNWRKAHFDPQVLERLELLSQGQPVSTSTDPDG